MKLEIIMEVAVGPPRPDVMLLQFARQQGWKEDAFENCGHLFSRYRFTVEASLLSPVLSEFEKVMRKYHASGHVSYVEWNELCECGMERELCE